MKNLKNVPLYAALIWIFSMCSLNEENISKHGKGEKIKVKFTYQGLLNISHSDLPGGRISSQEDNTWMVISVSNSVDDRVSYATFDPSFVATNALDTVTLEISRVPNLEYTIYAYAIRKGTSSGFMVSNGTFYGAYENAGNNGVLFSLTDNKFMDIPGPKALRYTGIYRDADSLNFKKQGLPELDVYSTIKRFRADTLADNGTINLNLERGAFAAEFLLKGNSALDSITLELGEDYWFNDHQFISTVQEDSIRKIYSFADDTFNRNGAASQTTTFQVYRNHTLIYTGNVTFTQNQILRFELILDEATGESSRLTTVNIIERELVRGDTIRIGG